MFCPVCGDEYQPQFDRCADCAVPLVERLEPPVDGAPSSGELVTVLETGSQSLVAIARSILDGAGIPYAARNQSLQNLFGWGAVGTGYNVVIGPVRLQVPLDCEEEARALLTEVPAWPAAVENPGDEDREEE